MSRRIREALEQTRSAAVITPAATPADQQARREAYQGALHRLRCRAGLLPVPLKDTAGQHLKTLSGQLRTSPKALPKKARSRFEALLTLDAQGMPGIRA
ncbi:hypothetical protein Q0M94_06485 [Deinococcus radiomollis]|uniref:hypothetical protein n=1 Tax=Deinococcus radiomollis TaxID=468916 RepID=UPI003891FB0E